MRLLTIPAIALGFVSLLTAQQPDPPPDSTGALGQKLSKIKPAGIMGVLIVGAGGSHDFPKYFIGTDSETLNAEKGIELTAKLNSPKAPELMAQAQALLYSGTHEQFARGNFQKALDDFADTGKGIVMVHATTCVHPNRSRHSLRTLG